MRNRKNRMGLVVLLAALLCFLCAFTAGAEDDNSLADLGITTEGAVLTPEFGYGTTEYTVSVPTGTQKLELQPVPTNPEAKVVLVEGTDLTDGGNGTVGVTVEAVNGSRYTYVLHVEADPARMLETEPPETEPPTETETETEPVTEPPTEPETEPQTEDPRFVKVDRSSLEEAENTIARLKTETASLRDRLNLIMKVLYGMIGFCVLLLFALIFQMLRKHDLRKELKRYRKFVAELPEEYQPKVPKKQEEYYPEDGYDQDGYAYDETAEGQDGYAYDEAANGQDGYAYDEAAEGQDGYAYDEAAEGRDGYAWDENADPAVQGTEAGYDANADAAMPEIGYDDATGIAGEEEPAFPAGEQEVDLDPLPMQQEPLKDDPSQVPKPEHARKVQKNPPEYQKPKKPARRRPVKHEEDQKNVEVTMIDL